MHSASGSEASAVEVCVESILELLKASKPSARRENFEFKIRYRLCCLVANIQWLHELNFVETSWDDTLIERVKLNPKDRETLFIIAGRIEEYKQRLRRLKQYGPS